MLMVLVPQPRTSRPPQYWQKLIWSKPKLTPSNSDSKLKEDGVRTVRGVAARRDFGATLPQQLLDWPTAAWRSQLVVPVSTLGTARTGRGPFVWAWPREQTSPKRGLREIRGPGPKASLLFAETPVRSIPRCH